MTIKCEHVDQLGNVCERPMGHPYLHGLAVEQPPSEILRLVVLSEDTGRFGWCTRCQETRLHRSDCAVYATRLSAALNKAVSEKDQAKKNLVEYRKENPSRPEIRKILDRRAAHIVDLQAAGTRRNEQIEHLERELEKERGRIGQAVDRRLEVERLEAQVFVLGNELEQATRTVGRLQEEIATQHSWDLREATDESMLEELTRRAIERDR